MLIDEPRLLHEPRIKRRDCQDFQDFLFETGHADEFLQEMADLLETNMNEIAVKVEASAGIPYNVINSPKQTALDKVAATYQCYIRSTNGNLKDYRVLCVDNKIILTRVKVGARTES